MAGNFENLNEKRRKIQKNSTEKLGGGVRKIQKNEFENFWKIHQKKMEENSINLIEKMAEKCKKFNWKKGGKLEK